MNRQVTRSAQLVDAANEQAAWSYQEAFCRNRGLITSVEQEKLRNSRVAVAGLGGVGGIDLVTLARLGIGRFTIADPDTFELANFNRQFGAMQSTLGRPKAEVMADIIHDINPEADIRVFCERVDASNADRFFQDADMFVDAIEAFDIKTRRMLFRMAANKGTYAISAGPIGFSSVCVMFDPRGMSFDTYFGISDEMDELQQFAAFIVGMAPRATHRSYLDLNYVNFESHTGPSLGLACQLAGGTVAAEVVKMLLGRGRLFCAPYYHQFDAYYSRYVKGRLLLGGRFHPLQRLKRWLLARFLQKRSAKS